MSESDPVTLPAGPSVDAHGRRTLIDHRDYLLSLVEPLTPFGVNLVDAWGLTLCEDIKADGDLPAQPVAETDGYALCFDDIATVPPGTRPVLTLAEPPVPARAVEEQSWFRRRRTSVPADEQAPVTPQPVLGIGETLPVRTGQALPPGADTVVAAWQTTAGMSGSRMTVTLHTKVAEGDWVRPVGAEARDGEMLAPLGTLITDRMSALLAAAGFDRVMVRPRTRVAVVNVIDSSTDPVGDDGRAPGAGMLMIIGAAKTDGATAWRVEIDLADPMRARERLSDELIRADLMLTVGGLGDDAADTRLVDLLADMGVVDVAEVAMRPGRLHGYGLIGDDRTPVIMLPTEPAALLAAYHAFARSMLRKLMGVEPFVHELVLCFAEHNIEADIDVAQLVPARLKQAGNRYLANEIMPRRHSQLPALTEADALVILPGDKRHVYADEALAAWVLTDKRSAPR